jgi:hypothetical protein
VDNFRPEADDPLYEPEKGCLIWQVDVKCCRARPYADFAVVEFRPQRSACLASESDLIYL